VLDAYPALAMLAAAGATPVAVGGTLLNEGADLSSLLAACARGDRAAFRKLYDAHSPRLYGVALRITRDAALAADALHDALIQAWQNAGRFDAVRGRAEAWLTSLVRYRALDLVRTRKREVVTDAPPERADDAPDAFDALSSKSDAAALLRCLETLEADKRRLIASAFVDGYSHSELAERMGLPLGTVKSWIRRGLEALRRCLEA
jgi:RNA polymerase sigma-70 factor, ECF subfamily